MLVTHYGTWAPLAVAGPLLAAIVVATDARTHALLRPSVKLVAFGLAAAAAMIIATYVLFDLLSRMAPALKPMTANLYGELRAAKFTPFERGALIPIVAIAEEIVFRSTSLREHDEVGVRHAVAAVLLTSLIVGAAHLASGSWLLALVAGLCGVYWGGLRALTRSCVPSIISHVLWDLAVLVVWPLF